MADGAFVVVVVVDADVSLFAGKPFAGLALVVVGATVVDFSYSL